MTSIEDIALSLQLSSVDFSEEKAFEKAVENLKVPIPDDLPWPGFIKHRRNVYGIPETIMRCTACECVYSVTPALKSSDTPESVCLSLECSSYDVNRDIDLYLGLGEGRLKRG